MPLEGLAITAPVAFGFACLLVLGIIELAFHDG